MKKSELIKNRNKRRVTVNKNIRKAIKFIKTLKEESFCRHQQTREFDKKNQGKSHCVLGHLFQNPASPFYIGEYKSGGVGWSEIESVFDDKFQGLAGVNNNAPEGKIKETVLAAMKAQINTKPYTKAY